LQGAFATGREKTMKFGRTGDKKMAETFTGRAIDGSNEVAWFEGISRSRRNCHIWRISLVYFASGFSSRKDNPQAQSATGGL